MADADIDLYADDIDHDFNQKGDYNHDSNVDLYDDVISGPSDDHHNEDGRPSSAGSSSPHQSRHGGKRVAVYVGNLTWWTTDQDLTEAIHSLGVNDIIEIKFYENRANGQSKGFCVVALATESSLRTVMDKLPKKELHGQNPAVTPCTRQNLNYFELQSRKGGHGGSNRHDNSNERKSRDRDRERDRDNRDSRQDNRSIQQGRSNRSNSGQYAQQQKMHAGPHMHHPPPHPQGPSPPQYQPAQTHWMAAPPPQIHQMPPPRPGAPQMATGGPPPPPGLHMPPHVRPGPPPPNNMRLPPPRGPLPPMGPRNIPPPDTRGPPPTNEWDRHMNQPPPQHVNMPPQPVGPPNRPPPPVPTPGQGMPPSIPPPSAPVPSPHINPAFFHQQGVPPGLAPASQSAEIYSRPPPVQFSDYRSVSDRGPDPSTPTISESEFEEIMGRNRTVSSSAIARAVADASTGDYASAIETLVTAISLIKQSKVANDERCKILISSLQDTLHGIESKSYGSRSKERARSRERERSRERSSRREKSSRRDRSRSRDREYRDRSRERDRYREDRYRDKERDHDRDHRSSRH